MIRVIMTQSLAVAMPTAYEQMLAKETQIKMPREQIMILKHKNAASTSLPGLKHSQRPFHRRVAQGAARRARTHERGAALLADALVRAVTMLHTGRHGVAIGLNARKIGWLQETVGCNCLGPEAASAECTHKRRQDLQRGPQCMADPCR